MKKSALIVVASLLFVMSYAQTPQAMNYQAVARNSLGQIVPSQNIGVRFTIQNAGGNVFYQETHSTTTNNFGLFTLAIGGGTAISGTMAAIDWSSGGDKFLKVEIDPQGGTNYTVQGTTQLISVPYALYSEKTKLVAGNAITITNGNTINANYVAGAGINITGNTISSTLNPWLLTGNAGTTAANFIGTTDDQRLYFRTNNKMRMFLEKSTVSSGSDLALLSLSDEAGSASNPAQLSIWGREIVGVSANMLIANNVVGQTWGQAVGNTQGRMIRFSQMTSSNFTQSHFYDLGISQDSSFYISDHWLQNGGPNTPKKMITISAQNLVGINLNNSEKPTANFHTKGSVRFQGLTANNTLNNILVTDANGNVSTRDASTLGSGGGNNWALLGNSGTTASNFVGTTDDQRLYFRTNNKMRMFLEKSTVSSGSDLALLSLSDEAGSASNPAQLSIWGREIVGVSANMLIANNVVGQTWGQAVGNTQGRMIRFSQMTSSNFTQSHFYDLGISQDSSFYISDHWLQNGGPNTPKKMITISAQNLVGINLDNSEKPTANFHTKGSVRFQGLTANNTLNNILVTDANGNVSTRDASTLGSGGGGWALIGNAGTTAANYLGTSDNQPMRIKTNNITRATFDPGVVDPFSGNVGTLSLSDFNSFSTAPGQLAVYGKDIPGVSMNAFFANSVQGMNWAPQGGNNNTMGRFFRLVQVTTNNILDGKLYDFGIDQGQSFFISEQGLQGGGPVFFKKMITITPNDFVGINFNWGEDPTANFHTKGTVRFQNLPSGTGNILVVDANGNVFRASQTASRTTDNDKTIQGLRDDLDQAKKEIAELKSLIIELEKKMNTTR